MHGTSLISAVLLALAVSAPAPGDPEELSPERRQELEKKANDLIKEGVRQHAARDYAKAKESFREAIAMYRALYPREKYPQGHTDLAKSIETLGMVHKEMAEYDKAKPLLREALDMWRALYPREKYPQGHPDLADSIYNLAYLHHLA